MAATIVAAHKIEYLFITNYKNNIITYVLFNQICR